MKLDTITRGDLRLTIWQDEFDTNPREWDNFGTMLCFHRSYALGDSDLPYSERDFEGWGEVRERLEADGALFIHTLYLFDHSGLSMSIGSSRFAAVDQAGWDWGQVGFIYATPDAIAANGWDAEKDADAIERCLRGEVDTFDKYLRGEVYGYTLEKVTTCDCCKQEVVDTVDCCGGFYSLDDLYANAGFDRDVA